MFFNSNGSKKQPISHEILVVNDGIADDTEDICNKWKDKFNIKYFFIGNRNKDLDSLIWRIPGFSINYAAKRSSGKMLILTNPEQKEKYEYIYDNNSQIKDFKDLKDNNTSDQFKFERLSELEFKNKIHELNVLNKGVFDKIEILDQKCAKDITNKMLMEREKYVHDLKDYYKEKYGDLNDISNITELKQKFNEIFENDDETPFDQNVEKVNTDISVFNGTDTLCNYTTLSNMHYDSMYSKDSLYDESFKINKSSKFINDNKTLEERMNDYLSNSDKLAELAKKSSSSNVNKATIN
jgi:hypothetical protein